MQSVARILSRRRGAVAGRAPLHLALVGALVVLQSVEIGGRFSLLADKLIWAAYPACVALLATSLGFAAAQSRAEGGWRTSLSERLRVAGPPYAFAVLAAALLLGPLLTTVGWRLYATDPAAYEYLLNLVGWPRYSLPGVFEFNDLSGVVNRNVWAAPFYLAVLATCCAPERRMLRFAPAAIAGVVAVAAIVVELLDAASGRALDFSNIAFRGDGLTALLGGLLGAALFRARRRVPLGGRLALAAAAAMGGMALVGNAGWAGSGVFRVLWAAPAAYLAIYLSFLRLPGQEPARRLAPYLPSFLLFSFPLQQLAVDQGAARQGALANLAIGAGAAVGLALVFHRLAGRRLLSGRQRDASAIATSKAGRGRRAVSLNWRNTRRRLGGMAVPLFVGAILLALCLGLMAMLYVAFLPDSGGF